MIYLAQRLPHGEAALQGVQEGPELAALWKDLMHRVSGRRPPPAKPLVALPETPPGPTQQVQSAETPAPAATPPEPDKPKPDEVW
jgi:hypothetical protein